MEYTGRDLRVAVGGLYCPVSVTKRHGAPTHQCTPDCIFHEVRLASGGCVHVESDGTPIAEYGGYSVFCKLAGEFVGDVIQSEKGGEEQ